MIDHQNSGALPEGVFDFVCDTMRDTRGDEVGIIAFAVGIKDQVNARTQAETLASEELLPEIDDAIHGATTCDDEHLALFRELEALSALTGPVTVRSLSIPSSPAAVRHCVEGPCVLPELEGLRVLVSYGEQGAREQIAALIEQCGAVVETAANADKSLYLLRTTRPDVLVADIGTPDEYGYVLMQKVRALPHDQGGRTPAVALAARATMEDRTRMLLAGFTIHVPKPVEPTELLVVLANIGGRLCQLQTVERARCAPGT
jgi:CheY-like chemotaxis protein